MNVVHRNGFRACNTKQTQGRSVAPRPCFIGCTIKKTMTMKCDVCHCGFKACNTQKLGHHFGLHVAQ